MARAFGPRRSDGGHRDGQDGQEKPCRRGRAIPGTKLIANDKQGGPGGSPRRILPLFDLNPAYGTGAFRRRVRLHHHDGLVDGSLSDNNHAMWVHLRHAGGAVTTIEGGFTRWPTDACPGAVAILRELVGTPVGTSRDELVADGRARRHCTHLYDLALLALAMAARPSDERLWDAVVPDAKEGRTSATLSLNGEEVLRWPLDHQVIVLPDDEPQLLLKGFGKWAAARYEGDLLEGAIILRMAAFTARARAHITDNRALPLRDFPERRGACFAYSAPQVGTAVHRIGVIRDLSDGF